MKIIPNTFAIFWSLPGDKTQFHADVGAKTAREAVASFSKYFPGDVIRSVRSTSGRFEAFK